jgi:hypothetical protein
LSPAAAAVMAAAQVQAAEQVAFFTRHHNLLRPIIILAQLVQAAEMKLAEQIQLWVH